MDVPSVPSHAYYATSSIVANISSYEAILVIKNCVDNCQKVWLAILGVDREPKPHKKLVYVFQAQCPM